MLLTKNLKENRSYDLHMCPDIRNNIRTVNQVMLWINTARLVIDTHRQLAHGLKEESFSPSQTVAAVGTWVCWWALCISGW